MSNTHRPGGSSQQPLVSLVTPVYNAAAHLERCLDSLQTQSVSDIEIICIDDGSRDRSRAILHRHAQSDRRMRILAQSNSGPAAARNRGMAQARGRYLGFIDADDWLEGDFIALLLDGIRRTSADLVRSSIINEFTDRSEAWHGNAYLQKRARNNENLGLNDHGFYVWNALYDLQRLRGFGLDRFDAGCDGLEDMPFTVRATHLLEQRRAVPEAAYHYRRGLPDQLTAISLTKIRRSLVANRLCIDFANRFPYRKPEDYADVVSRNVKNLLSHFYRGMTQIPEQFDDQARRHFYMAFCDLFRSHTRHEILSAYRPSPLYATLDEEHFPEFCSLSLACDVQHPAGAGQAAA